MSSCVHTWKELRQLSCSFQEQICLASMSSLYLVCMRNFLRDAELIPLCCVCEELPSATCKLEFQQLSVSSKFNRINRKLHFIVLSHMKLKASYQHLISRHDGNAPNIFDMMNCIVNQHEAEATINRNSGAVWPMPTTSKFNRQKAIAVRFGKARRNSRCRKSGGIASDAINDADGERRKTFNFVLPCHDAIRFLFNLLRFFSSSFSDFFFSSTHMS